VILDWPGCTNARDVGGLPTTDGSATRPRALLRSDHHAALTPEALDSIRTAGISRIIDLRRDRELAEHPSPFAADPIYRHAPLLPDVTTYDHPDDSYGPLLDHNQQRIATAFHAIASAPPGGVLVHCHSGRDRTGVLVALALSIAGVEPDAIAEDYALTENSPAAAMRSTLDHLQDRYGGVPAYLRRIGVPESDIEAVRNRLREPAYLTETRDGYNRFAPEYAELFDNRLPGAIWERAMLGGFADLVQAAPGPVIEAGSGTGEITAYLNDRGLDIAGLDLSPAMVELARRRYPSIPFEVGSMTAINRPDTSLAAVVAWYSIIHIADEDLPSVLLEFRRVLRPGGYVALAFQVGRAARQVRDLTFRRRLPEEVAAAARAAGLEVCFEAVQAAEDQGPAEALPQAYMVLRRPGGA